VLRDQSSRRDAWTARLVWGIWAALTVAAIGLILALGTDMPFWDDWSDMVSFYAGVLPVDAGTLWLPHNEHHIPLSRLILMGLARATDHDLRAGAVFNAVALSAASALLLRSARNVDGRLRLADCALPLLLLHWGQYVTILWSYQVHAALLVLIASALLALLSRRPDPPPPRSIIAFGTGLLTLPLCQAAGIALAPLLAAWCGVVGVLGLRSPEPARRRAGWAALALAAAAIVLAALAYVPPRWETAGDPTRVLWWSAVMLSTAFGMTERVSPFALVLLPVVAATLMLATGALLLHVIRTQPRERLRAVGLGLFLLAFLGLALGIAWGRRDMALSNRYPVLAAPFFCAVYLSWRRYGPGRSGGLVCAAMCALLVMLAPWNAAAGLDFARHRAEIASAFERDVYAGVPMEGLVSRYVPELHHARVTLRRGLVNLRNAEIGVFRHIVGGPR